MSELDFDQKLELRRAFWAMGASARIDVKLSALVNPRSTKTRSGAEEWTDLDVLGVQYTPLSGLNFAVADCKTTRTRATERVFWLRGVADLFGARSAYLSRGSDLPQAARQLALRLGIRAMDDSDRADLLDQAGKAQLPAVGQFLAGPTVRRWEALSNSAPVSLEKLGRYRRTFYWVFPRHRNLTLLPAYLTEAANKFDPRQRWALVWVIDLAWLYLLSVLHAVEEITHLHLSRVEASLRQAIVGSEQEMREKEELASRIRELISFADGRQAGQPPEVRVMPAYFPDLLDLVSRTIRRRSQANEALRILEFTGMETVANTGPFWLQAFPSGDPLSVKLASDVVRFLCRAAGLPGSLVSDFDAAVEGRSSARFSNGDNDRSQPELFHGVSVMDPATSPLTSPTGQQKADS